MLDTLLRTDEDLIPASNRCTVHRVNIEVLVIGRLIWPVLSGAKRGATIVPREQVSTPGELTFFHATACFWQVRPAGATSCEGSLCVSPP